ncbi:hypothetical phage protein [Candidatus Regiella insecticola]|uniref:Hypothetical phage protein n=2 Tax=Candidatus Regiella insecticola TaxID=138073 RepID=A0A6L2ZSJ5_9ENTR|nr:hypothetical phage protein [Candidatus Regiella insecticola]
MLMAQVAFDTQEFVETLESAGFPINQAKALSVAVRKSHEVADVATKRDLEDVRRDLSAEIVGLRKDMEARFEKTDAQMEARFAQMEARFEKTDAQMEARFEKTEAQIADVRKDFLTEMSLMRKDIEKSGMQTTIRLGGMLVVAVGVILAVLKIPF